MNLEIIDPVDYPGWDELLLKSGDDSFFHTSAWARVLRESYGFRPVYFACFKDNRLSFLMPFMEVTSFLTGKRGVSLPFTDSCYPFAPAEGSFIEAVLGVADFGRHAKWEYAEWRGAEIPETIPVSHECYFTHDIDLTRAEAKIFSGLRESNRRNINRAARDGIKVEFGVWPGSLAYFYRLNCITRKRHGLPPQPLSFFKNVLKYVISRGYGTIVAARYERKVVASSIFFHFGKVALFKYGASNPKYLSHRPNNLIMWETLKWYKAQGMSSLNLGRTEVDNHGLLRFKRAWGPLEKTLKYCRFNLGGRDGLRWALKWGRPSKLVSSAPLFALRVLGRMLYKHIG